MDKVHKATQTTWPDGETTKPDIEFLRLSKKEQEDILAYTRLTQEEKKMASAYVAFAKHVRIIPT